MRYAKKLPAFLGVIFATFLCGFALHTQGNKLLVSINLSGTQFVGGSPSNTIVGALTVSTTGPRFTGTLALSTTGPCSGFGTNNSSFAIVTGNLVTNGVVVAGSYDVCLTATQTDYKNNPLGNHFTITGTQQNIASIGLSNSTFVGGSLSGTVVGALSVTMSPTSPAFSGGLSLSNIGGGCNSANGANNSQFSISAGNIVTSGTVNSGIYQVCVLATQFGAANSPLGQPFTLTTNQSISDIALSNSNFLSGSLIGTNVGNVNVTMFPSSPGFTGSLALDASCGANCADSSKFQLSGAGCAGGGGTCTLQIATGGAATPTFVRGSACNNATSCAMSAAAAAGTVLIGGFGWDNGGGSTITSISDGAGGTGDIATVANGRLSAQTCDSGNTQCGVIFCLPVTGAPTTVFANISGSQSGSQRFIVDNFSAVSSCTLDPSNGALLQTGVAAGANALNSGTAKVTTQSNDLVYGLTESTAATAPAITAGTSPITFAQRQSIANVMMSESFVQPSAGSIQATFGTGGAGGNFITFISPIRAAAGGLGVGVYHISLIATQAGAGGSPFEKLNLLVNGVDGPTSVSLAPSSVSLADSCTTSSCAGTLSAISVTMTGGSFGGSLSSNNAICAISGSNVVLGRNLSAADDGARSCIITATQNGFSAQSTFTVNVQTQSIQTINLSSTAVPAGSPSGTTVGAITVPMSPVIPAFAGSVVLGAAGSCSGTNNGSFNIVGTNLVTNGVLVGGNYVICLIATQSGITNSPLSVAFGINVGIEVAGPSAQLFANPTSYACSTNRFVSTTGSNSNNGTTSGTPWLTMAFAQSQLPSPAPGWCVNFAPGTYSMPQLTMNKGGNLASTTGYLVYRCTTINACVLQTTSVNAPFLQMEANYIQFDGMDVNCANNIGYICLATGPDAGNFRGHHFWFLNGTVRGAQLSGIQWNNSEYFWVLHSIFTGNSSGTTGIYGSGISYYNPIAVPGYTPTAQDNAWAPYKIITNFNIFHDNFNIQSGSGNSDGNGLIWDDWSCSQNPGTCGVYAGQGLTMGNVTWHNGGSGVRSSFGGQGVFANNTSYNDYFDTHNTGTFRAGIGGSDMRGISFINNIAVAVPANNQPFQDSTPVVASTWRNNISSGGNGNNIDGGATVYPTTGTNRNSSGVSPNMVNPASNNFALCIANGSPAGCTAASIARGFGQSFSFWPQSGTPDTGACQGALTTCP